MHSPVTIFVVVLSYNGLADTRKCLASLLPAIRPGVTPVLVDNGSTDGTAEAVAAEFPWCRLLRVEVNRGPVGGNNAGIRAALEAQAQWILLLNNDTTVHADIFDRLMEAAVANPEFSVLGPVIKFMDDPDVVMTEGDLFNLPGSYAFFTRVPVPLKESRPPHATPVDMVNGCCLMIQADMIARIGSFDETIFMYHDEADLCLRVLEAGGKLGIIDHALVWHKGSATSTGTGKRSVRYFDARNLWYLLKKHHFYPVRGRSPWNTRVAYLRYAYYWYCAERETGNDVAAAAVLDGVSDGLAGVSGPYRNRRRFLRPFFKVGFETLRRLQGPSAKALHT